MPLPAEVRAFEERGRRVRVGAHHVFAMETEPVGRPTLLLLHGFPTSSYDFVAAMDRLGDRYRIVTLDYVGFGLSDKPARFGYSIFEHADAVECVARALGVGECHLLGHDLGTSVVCELLARRERGLLGFAPRTVTLTNGSVHIELSQLTLSQRALLTRVGPLVARLGSEALFRAQMTRLFGKPVDERELSAMWALLSREDGGARLHQTISYVPERYRFAERWIGALERLDLPAHLLWGVLDPVAVVAIAELLAREIPMVTLTRLEGVGHYPQVEAPDAWSDAVRAFTAPHDPSP